MPVTPDKPAPYATSGAILDLIHRYRDRGLPQPITGDVLGRAGIAQTLISRTLYALQALDLIDKKTGMPTETFEALRVAPEAEFKKRLGDWLKGAYADVFSFVDPMKDGEARIRDAFRNYQPIGQQGRMVLLFQGLCTEAGLMPVKQATASASPPRQRPPATPSPQPASRSTSRQASRNSPPPKPRHAAPSGQLPPALAGLLESLPDDGWTTAERDKFLTTFKAVLDFCIPVVHRKPEPVSDAAE
jgi:hypothetical protein